MTRSEVAWKLTVPLYMLADCDTCRWIAPEFFGRENEQSAMIRQPETEAERVQSFQALVSCPT